ncbi:MAG: hypothetical protein KAS02_00065 [Candidatus Pacebacteria bacterium]|nr:hypothetical protein [Candidatus Paceibacterota bacterium]
MKKINRNLVEAGNARNEDYKQLLKKIIKDGLCPFCWENFEKYHPKPIFEKRKYWLVSENIYPYENSKNHFILVAKRHLIFPSELSKEEWQELLELIEFLKEKTNSNSGTLLMRFGETINTGASVEHLHAQFIVAKDKRYPIITRIG